MLQKKTNFCLKISWTLFRPKQSYISFPLILMGGVLQKMISVEKSSAQLLIQSSQNMFIIGLQKLSWFFSPVRCQLSDADQNWPKVHDRKPIFCHLSANNKYEPF